jgi:pantoate--beta-alanine ligase
VGEKGLFGVAGSPSEIIVVSRVAELRALLDERRRSGQSVGFVPTMGALHAGHGALVAQASRETDCTVVSLFVNPTQFAPHEDFSRYPRTFDSDLELCRQNGASVLWNPGVEDMYPAGSATFVEVESVSREWEGAFRPTHFRGVATVVLKLFAAVEPQIAYFGQKDYQQQAVIRAMTRDLLLPVEIRVCPTVRDPDGLAMSSRNRYLSPDERVAALSLSRGLFAMRDAITRGGRDFAALRQQFRKLLDSTPLVETQYATIADPETLREVDSPTDVTTPGGRVVALVAVKVGSTRLIDNNVIRFAE